MNLSSVVLGVWLVTMGVLAVVFADRFARACRASAAVLYGERFAGRVVAYKAINIAFGTILMVLGVCAMLGLLHFK